MTNIGGRIEAGAGWCMHYYQFDFAKIKLHYELYHMIDMGFTWDVKQDSNLQMNFESSI